MTEMMKSILGRVLSQEIAHQENWKADDIRRFGEDKVNRDEIIAQVKDFMEENGIQFREDFYFDELK